MKTKHTKELREILNKLETLISQGAKIVHVRHLLEKALTSREEELTEELKKTIELMENLKYNELLDSEMRIVNMIVRSCQKPINNILNSLKRKDK